MTTWLLLYCFLSCFNYSCWSDDCFSLTVPWSDFALTALCKLTFFALHYITLHCLFSEESRDRVCDNFTIVCLLANRDDDVFCCKFNVLYIWYFWIKFQVRRATREYRETVVFLACQDRQVHLVLGVQMAFQGWMDSQVFILIYFVIH